MTKYRVYIETGYVEFTNLQQAEDLHNQFGIQPIETIEYELITQQVEI